MRYSRLLPRPWCALLLLLTTRAVFSPVRNACAASHHNFPTANPSLVPVAPPLSTAAACLATHPLFSRPSPQCPPSPLTTSTMVPRAFVATVPPHFPVTPSLAAPTPSPAPSAAASTGVASSRGAASAATSARGAGRHRTAPTASIVTASVVQSEMERLGGFVAATAGIPRAPARAIQAAGTLVGAARVMEKEVPNVRVCVYLSGVTPTGMVKWLILHGSAVSNDPELMRVEAQVQHAARAVESAVFAGSSLQVLPATHVGDAVPVGDNLVAVPPAAVVSPFPPGPGSVYFPWGSSSSGGAAAARPVSTSTASTPTPEERRKADADLEEACNAPTFDAMLRLQRAASSQGTHDPPATPPPGVAGAGGSTPARSNAAVRPSLNDDRAADERVADLDGDAAAHPDERQADADLGTMDRQPVLDPRPLPIIESVEPPEIVCPSKKAVDRLLSLLAVDSRPAFRLREMFRGVIAVLASRHNCSVKSIQDVFTPWWWFRLAAVGEPAANPGSIWAMRVNVPKRLLLTTKRSRTDASDATETITLDALPSSAGVIDHIVAALLLLHDKEESTQVTMTNYVYLAEKAAAAAKLKASTSGHGRKRNSRGSPAAAAAAPSAARIAPSASAAAPAWTCPFPPMLPRPPQQSIIKTLGELAARSSTTAKGKARASPSGSASPSRQRLLTPSRPAVAVRTAARVAAARAAGVELAAAAVLPHAAGESMAGASVPQPPPGDKANQTATKRRRVTIGAGGRADSPQSIGLLAEASSDEEEGAGIGEPCTTSGSCILLSRAGSPVASADVDFERRTLHGQDVPPYLVVVKVGTVLSPGTLYRHKREFPKERPSTGSMMAMRELAGYFIVWEKDGVVVNTMM